MRKVILDTDTLSEIFKERNQAVLARAEEYLQQHEALTFMSVTASELLYGLYSKDAKSQIVRAKRFLRSHEELVPTSKDYWLVAEVNALLRKGGRPIGDADAMIAACAINRGLPVVTGNTRHYQFVIEAGFDLELDDWRKL